MDSVIQNVIRVLHEQGLPAAHQYVESRISPAVDQVRAALKAAEAVETNCKALLNAAAYVGEPFALPTAGGAVIALPSAATTDGQPGEEDAKALVLQEAEALALSAEDRVIHLKDLVARLESRGVKLRSSRPGTSAAIWLSRSQRWARVRPSQFRLK